MGKVWEVWEGIQIQTEAQGVEETISNVIQAKLSSFRLTLTLPYN